MSGIYDFTLTTGATQYIPASGNLFKVISASGGTVRVRLDTGESYKLKAGQGARLPDGKTFREVQVTDTSGAAQVGSIFIGDSGTIDDRVTGDVGIIDSVGPLTVSQFLQDLTAAFTAQAYVLPAANPNGVVIRASTVDVFAGASAAAGRLIAAPSAPGVMTPAGKSIILNSAYSVGGATVQTTSALFEQRRMIPPGWGLYFIKSAGAVPSVCGGTVSYEILGT